jgi:hypothetical protein
MAMSFINIITYSIPWFNTTDEHITAICERNNTLAETKVQEESPRCTGIWTWYRTDLTTYLLIMQYATANVQWMSEKVYTIEQYFYSQYQIGCKCVRGILILQNAVHIIWQGHYPYSHRHSTHAAQALLRHHVPRGTKFLHPLHSLHHY